MVQVTSLWLPILVSAAVVFVASSVIHMLLGYHRADYGLLPGEDDVQAALRKFNLPTGDFELPHPQSPKDASSQAFREKLDKGPVVLMTVMPSGGLRRWAATWRSGSSGGTGRRIPDWSRAAGRYGLSSSLSVREHGCVRRLCARPLADVYLVQSLLGDDHQDECRWVGLRVAHGGHLRLALAALAASNGCAAITRI